LLRLLNDNLIRMTSAQFKEKHEANLMYMFDIVFNLITYITEPSIEEDPFREAKGDTLHEYFLTGRAVVGLSFLKEINIIILYQLFMNLPPRMQNHNFNQVKVTLLIMIIEKCKERQNLDSIGTGFFRQLVHDRSPELAFYASRFLMEIIQTERPEQYTAVLSTLLKQAQITNDEQLLKNPYLQILEILNLFGGSSDTNTATT